MIVPMYKYAFFVYHKDYGQFLKELHKVGVLHVVEKNSKLNKAIQQKTKEIAEIDKTIQFLCQCKPSQVKNTSKCNGDEIVLDVSGKIAELENLEIQLDIDKKELIKSKHWGDFSREQIRMLKNENVHLKFFTASKKKFQEIKQKGLPLKQITETGDLVYFVLILYKAQELKLDATEVALPRHSCSDLVNNISKTESEIKRIKQCFADYAENAISVLESDKKKKYNSLAFDKVVLSTAVEVEDKLMILEGWVPKTKKENLDLLLNKINIVSVCTKAKPGDKIPIILKNNRFTKLFEPIGTLFSLPDYSELDLTIFFAPFFMLFFGFCLGDAGYGLLFIFGGGLYKLKAKKELKPYLSLIQLLGIATLILGTISGTFFGINLIEAEVSWLEEYKTLFLNPDKMFNLALLLGALQIIFGLFIRAANQIRQFGFSYALATLGWLIILLGSSFYILAVKAEMMVANKTFLILVLSVGGFFILFFSDPEINFFARIGKGVWDIYSTVTGIFGDLLSYIRLFALGLSSAILGFVINDIGIQILGSSKILGPIFFAVFLLLGHTLNILISSLGSFVHPMRLTFVEFYKSAGFKGGGMEYIPFGKNPS